MRNSLPVKKEPTQGTYIPLKHAILFILLVIAIPPCIGWVKDWANQEGEKREAEIRTVVEQTLQQQLSTLGSVPVEHVPDTAVLERVKQLESIVGNLQRELRNTPQYKNEIDDINKALLDFNTRLLLLADEVDKVTPGFAPNPE